MEIGEHVVNRYRIERLIGRGGAAVVYEVTDDQSGKRLAMKRLALEDNRRGQAWILFQREFHTLAQLTHPLIIRAYDYGFDRGIPYYTMELLAGTDLRSVGAVPFREACSLGRDVASALAIVHSRRLLHRDVTLRNVCRTADGRAKLLDFGALAPMGPTRDLVGTPSFMAPESLQELALDGRADLFSLGACLYYLLTGRQAFPARKISDLAEAWRQTPTAPSRFAEDVPPALDDLVLSLLSLNAAARPSGAAEVFERLSVVANLDTSEAPEVARSYLLTPTLVAREAAVDRFARRVTRAQRGRGGALIVEADSGMGRSRLLSNLLLDAKLRGVLVIRGAGGDHTGRSFGVIGAMARALVAEEPTLARDAAGPSAALLSPVLFPSEGDGPMTQSWAKIAEALTSFFIAVSRHSPLVLGVDDFDACDEQSGTVLLRVSNSSPSLPLIVVVTARRDSRNALVGRFRATASALVLRPMAPEETRSLVSSLFGEVPNVEAVARWVHRSAGGSPRAILEIAQHFVDQGIAEYRQGSWTLPADLEELDLPANLGQALDARVASLTPLARTLGEALSLSTPNWPVPLSSYATLVEAADDDVLFGVLNELIQKGILVERGTGYEFSHGEVIDALRRAIPASYLAALHRRLSRAYDSETANGTIVAHHLVEAGDMREAFDRVVAAVHRREIRSGNFARSIHGAKLVDRLFQWARDNRVRPADLMILGRRVMQIASVTDVTLARHGSFLLERLQHDCGLDLMSRFAHVEDPAERVRLAIGAAFARYQETPEAERGLPPPEAIHELTVTTANLNGALVRKLDVPQVEALVPILEPLRALSPAIDVIAEITSYSADSMRGESIVKRRAKVLESLAEPMAGFDEDTRIGTRLTNLYYATMEELPAGRKGVEDRLAPLDDYPQYAPLAWHARLLAHLFRGEDAKAEQARRRRDLAILDCADVDLHLEIGIIYEGTVSELLDDLLGVKRVLTLFEEKAETLPGWVSYRELHLGNYHHLRGERDKALTHYQAALEQIRTERRFAAYVHVCVRYALALVEYGLAERAHEVAMEGLGITERHKVPGGSHVSIHLALASAEAALGQGQAAVARADTVIAALEKSGTLGIVLIHHLATRARIALRLSDRETFDRIAAKIGKLCVDSEGTSLSAKHARLMRDASLTTRFEAVGNKTTRLGGAESAHTTLASDLKTRFERCQGGDERSGLALDVLLDAAAVQMGFLYLLRDGELQLAATTEGDVPPEHLEAEISERVSDLHNETTASITSVERPVQGGDTAFRFLELFAGKPSELLLVGIAALRNSARARAVPQDLLQAVGENLLDSGDATGRPATPEVRAGL